MKNPWRSPVEIATWFLSEYLVVRKEPKAPACSPWIYEWVVRECEAGHRQQIDTDRELLELAVAQYPDLKKGGFHKLLHPYVDPKDAPRFIYDVWLANYHWCKGNNFIPGGDMEEAEEARRLLIEEYFDWQASRALERGRKEIDLLVFGMGDEVFKKWKAIWEDKLSSVLLEGGPSGNDPDAMDETM